MDQLDSTGINQLLNLFKEIPGSSICCKNVEGAILWHNTSMVQNLKLTQNDFKGKSVSDLISIESADLCVEYDLQAIQSKSTQCRYIDIQLITGEKQEYFTTTIPWMTTPTKVGGIIINAINTKQNTYQEFKNDCYNQSTIYLNTQLQELYFNCKHPLEKILFLANIITSTNTSNSIKSLCLELKNFANILLNDCNNILSSEKILNSQQVPIILKKINLRKLIPLIFNKLNKKFIYKSHNLFLTISNKIPKIVISDLFRINKALSAIMKMLLNLSPGCIKSSITMLCTIRLLKKFNNNILISLFFELQETLSQELIMNEQQMQNTHYDAFELNFANNLAKDLGGNIYCINNKVSLQIIFNLPVEVCSN